MRYSRAERSLHYGIVILLCVLVSTCHIVRADMLGTDDYDPLIMDASERWLPGSDWKRYRAQLYQESLLDPLATSHAGAQGIAQFMPGTWGEVAPLLGFDGLSPYLAEPAIEAGAFYLSKQMATWTEPRPYIEQRRLGESGYNAGTGNIIKAQWHCRNGCGPCGGLCRDWSEIKLCLSLVTGRHSHETITYIERIERWLMYMRVSR